MSGKMIRRSRIREISAAFVLVLLLFINILTNAVVADELISRKITISDAFPSAVATHSFSFTTAGLSTVGSIGFEYCSNSPLHEDSCTAPSGLNASSFSLDSQTGISGFSISSSTTANHVILTKVPAVHGATATTYSFGNITNPSAVNQPTYVRISLYDGQNATGSRVDRGSVVFVTNDGYDVSAFVPPYLTFCVGVTVALNCSTTDGSLVNFGELSENTTSTTTTQFSVATNDGDGYNTYITGQTMTSGNNVISALTTQSSSQAGVSQFGMNLRSNSSPSIGANMEGEVVSSGSPANEYNQANQFRFVNGDRLAGSPRSTGFNRYTVSYILNVPEDQAPGVYATTLSFVSVATF